MNLVLMLLGVKENHERWLFLDFIGGEGYKWILATDFRRGIGGNGELRKRMGCRFGKGG